MSICFYILIPLSFYGCFSGKHQLQRLSIYQSLKLYQQIFICSIWSAKHVMLLTYAIKTNMICMPGYECACLMTYYRICCTVWNFIDNPLSDFFFFFGNWVVLQYLEALHPVKIFNLISCAEYSWNLPCQYHEFILSCKIQHIVYSGLRKLVDLCSLKSWRKYLAAPVKCRGCF